jgi:hypothetical protein
VKRELKYRHVESVDFVFLCDVNESTMASCNIVLVSEFNDYWLTVCLY